MFTTVHTLHQTLLKLESKMLLNFLQILSFGKKENIDLETFSGVMKLKPLHIKNSGDNNY